MEAEFRVTGIEKALSDDIKLALYRITQEGLNNVWKHSQASKAGVELEYAPGKVRLSITDNGVGFDPSIRTGSRLGLIGMRERASLIKADLRIDSRPGKGTAVTVEINMKES